MARTPLDCLIVGAGPAGLTAALYLARFGRRFAVLDAGDSRAARIPRTMTLPLFPGGISGSQLLATMRRHLRRYGVRIRRARVTALERTRGGWRVRLARGAPLSAEHVILCTGALDVELPLPEVASAVRDGLIRYCPICDGPEVAGNHIGVIGPARRAVREALFIARTYSRRVTVIAPGRKPALAPRIETEVRRRKLRVLTRRLAGLSFHERRGACVRFADGTSECFDTLYTALGLEARSELAARAGAACSRKGMLRVDRYQQTTLPGLYAAGGVVEGLDQLLVAMGQAAVAATDVHNRTRRAVLPARTRQRR